MSPAFDTILKTVDRFLHGEDLSIHLLKHSEGDAHIVVRGGVFQVEEDDFSRKVVITTVVCHHCRGINPKFEVMHENSVLKVPLLLSEETGPMTGML
jgi:hypothetical protein